MPAHQSKLINVSNRLPISLGEDGSIKRSSGGLVAALEGLPQDRFNLQWLGWPGAAIKEEDERHRLRERLQKEFGCSPVFMSDEEAAGFYEGFSNSSIWPLLHSMPSRFRYEPKWWDDYQAINQRFADEVIAIAGDDDLVWVHDYQLILLPAMLKIAKPNLRVGFFLHTPFPSHEIFQVHPKRAELLRGLLGADRLGFHTFSYLRHFQGALLHLLGIESEMLNVRHDRQTSVVGVYPIGINAKKIDQELRVDACIAEQAMFRETFAGKKIILSVERLDYTKGILRRLDAIDLFLSEQSPDERDKLKFIFVSVPSRENIEEYQELLEGVEGRIGQINGKQATLHNSPIHFIHGSVTFTELCALYSIADVCTVTPLVDGMNLVAKEYVAGQSDEKSAGVLILSEFAGAAQELFNALIVNPYDTQAMSEALRQALSMPADERDRRMAAMRHRVMNFDAGWWARTFIDDLSSSPPQSETTDKYLDPTIASDKLSAARGSHQRIGLFLDYDGTLREIERQPSAAFPSPELIRFVRNLSELSNTRVTVISGRSVDDLQRFLGELPIGLIAEHGAAIRAPGEMNWQWQDATSDYAWKSQLMSVLRLYEASTPGSFIEEKRTSLVWHYRQSDPEFGTWKAKQLVEALSAFTANEPVTIRHGRKIVEIVASQINKGAAVARLLTLDRYDLVLCAGDDTTDESMFKLAVPNGLMIHIGHGDTNAAFRLPSPAMLRVFLAKALLNLAD